MIATTIPIDVQSLINRALGPGVTVRFTETKSGFWWCELHLTPIQFTRAIVCCPGVNPMSAAVNAVKQAERLRKMVA